MEIPRKIIANWKILKEQGDIEKMVTEAKDDGISIHSITIGRAFRSPHRVNEKTFEVMKKFFNEKALKQEKAKKEVIMVDDLN